VKKVAGSRALPAFITFTGAGARTSIAGMMALAADYPVEFGLMLSPSRQGTGRFPPLPFVRKALSFRNNNFKLAAHLCDEYCENLIRKQATGLEESGLLNGFYRVQVNSDNPRASPKKIGAWAASQGGMIAILQCTDDFPVDDNVQWLFDPSSGSGTRPESWPAAPGSDAVGYAGGINPGNVGEVCRQLGRLARNYWIDMASGVRDDRGQFDLEKCRKVCKAVYGRPVKA
jgi:hypothetical protein